MARHYSTKDFFRQMPNALLARYFHAREVFRDLDFSAMKETQPDGLFAAWLYLPDAKRNEMDAEFRDIFELSCEKGFAAIRDEADWQFIKQQNDPEAYKAFVERLAGLSNQLVVRRTSERNCVELIALDPGRAILALHGSSALRRSVR